MNRIDYRNAMYCGNLTNRLEREGVGLLITDSSELLFAQWKNDRVDGQYFYNNADVSAFGQMKQGKYEGYNVFLQQDFTVFANCKNNRFDGAVLVRFSDGAAEAYEFSEGKKVKILQLKGHPESITQDLVLRLDALVKKSNKFSLKNLASSQMYLGSLQNGQPSGLGFTLREAVKVIEVGSFLQGQLNGLGTRRNLNKLEDGIFKKGQLHGMGCKWDIINKKYCFAQFRSKKTQVYIDGIGDFPKQQSHQIKKEFHLRSPYFINTWIVMRKIIKVDYQQIIKGNKPKSKLKKWSHNLHLNLDLINMTPQSKTFSLKNPKSVKIQPRSTLKEDTLDLLFQSQQQNQNLKEKSFQIYNVSSLGAGQSLEDAIKQYEYLSKIKNQHENRLTPKKKRK